MTATTRLANPESPSGSVSSVKSFNTAKPIQGAPERKPRYRSTPAPYLFVAPFVLLFVVFMLAPMVVAIYQSFFTVKRSGLGFTGGRQTLFAGISNYLTAFHDHEFMTSFLRVLMFGVIQVPIMIGLRWSSRCSSIRRW